MRSTDALRWIIAALIVMFCSTGLAQQSGLAITNVNIFDGVNERITDNLTVLISDRRISRLQASTDTVPESYQVVDGLGFYLMPGLIDVHTHLASLEQARRALESGVTTVRSASVSAYQDVALKELVDRGILAGPDVVPAGVFVTPELGDTILADPRLSALADGVRTDDELRLLVQINSERGARVIKTRGTERAGLVDNDPRKQVYSEQQLRIIVEEAERHDMSVMAHAYGEEGARAAVLAGVRSLEHGAYLSPDTLRIMADRGTWLVPTFTTIDGMANNSSSALLQLRGRMMLPALAQTIRNADALGVNLATGVDTNYGADSLSRIAIEASHFVQLGLSNFRALQAATVSAAELLQLDGQTGRIAPGYEADLILVPANPLTAIEALQDVLLVVSNGRVALQRFPFALGQTDQ
jgi:imidazolonepropionase-like amidohydrolase